MIVACALPSFTTVAGLATMLAPVAGGETNWIVGWVLRVTPSVVSVMVKVTFSGTVSVTVKVPPRRVTLEGPLAAETTAWLPALGVTVTILPATG